ncbi:unnamed protein product, partial [Didymodactylos carnosus]
HMKSSLQEADYSKEISLLTDSYINRVMQNRSFEYAREKLINMFKWKHEFKVDKITLEQITKPLSFASLYWYGYDKLNHPILYVRSNLKDWSKFDVDLEISMHIFMIETCIQNFLPPGIDQFVIISDSQLSLRSINIGFMKRLLQLLTISYPDRLEYLRVGPVNQFLKSLYTTLKPFMSKPLVQKIQLLIHPNEELISTIDEYDIPIFMGGTKQHDFIFVPAANKRNKHQAVAQEMNNSLKRKEKSPKIKEIKTTFNWDLMMKHQQQCYEEILNRMNLTESTNSE